MLSVGGLFDGCGLLAYGLTLAGFEHAWLCEVDPWRRELLALRWPGVGIYDDVRAVDARAERVDLIAGGFPCKGASTAGKRTGFDHPETVLWREMARAIGDLRPRYVLVENVANILAIRDGAVWGEVLGDLAALGFDVVWDCVPAAAFGAPHLRDRVIALATNADRDPVWQQPEPVRRSSGGPIIGGSPATAANAGRAGRQERDSAIAGGQTLAGATDTSPNAQDADRRAAQPARGERGGEPQGAGRPLAVDWGEYGPAIRRWERALGRPAGAPLLQGVAARSARRLVRSRLSALGDGVQVQLGGLAGEHILAIERERLMKAAA